MITTTPLALYAALGVCAYATPTTAGAQVTSAVSAQVTPAVATAQNKSRARGFFVGGSYEGNGVAFQNGDGAHLGPGFGVTLGYGFTPRLALYGQLSGVSDDSVYGNYGLGHIDLGLRVHVRAPAKTVVPFVQLGISSRGLTQIGLNTVDADGVGVAFGGGINVHFKPALAFSTGVTWSAGNLHNFKVTGSAVPVDSLAMTTARIHLGIAFLGSGTPPRHPARSHHRL